MKKAFSLLAQSLLFFVTFGLGIILGAFNPMHLRWFVTHPTLQTTRYFDPTGLILMLLLYLLILLIEAARKIIRYSGPRTSIALLLALIAGLLLNFGFGS